MRNQNQWLDMYKRASSTYSDYQLAKKWKTSSARISQLRRGRLKLSFAECLEIAQVLDIEPLEILASQAFKQCKEHEKEAVKNVFFEALEKTIGRRMGQECGWGFKRFKGFRR